MTSFFRWKQTLRRVGKSVERKKGIVWSKEDTLLNKGSKRSCSAVKILRKKRMGANNNEYHAKNPFAHNLSRLKENGKLTFRKCFGHNKLFNVQKCSREMAFLRVNRWPLFQKWNNRFIDTWTEWLFWNNPEYTLIPE